MDHAPRVGIGHRLADLLEDRQKRGRSLRWIGAFVEQGARVCPLTSFMAK